MLPSDWVAKASLSSTAPSWSAVQPLRAKAFSVAGTGPRPMISGARPALVASTTRARAFRPYFSAARSETTRIAEAPSFREEELPAVTTEPPLTTGRSLASTSGVVPSRGPSSVSTTEVAPFLPVTVTGVISWARRPSAIAARALA